MMFTFAVGGLEAEWSRALMMGWLTIALGLSVIEVFWLKGGFSAGQPCRVLKHKN